MECFQVGAHSAFAARAPSAVIQRFRFKDLRGSGLKLGDRKRYGQLLAGEHGRVDLHLAKLDRGGGVVFCRYWLGHGLAQSRCLVDRKSRWALEMRSPSDPAGACPKIIVKSSYSGLHFSAIAS